MDVLVKKILSEFKNLLRSKVRLQKLLLFGSRARGDSEKYSDLDVVVIVEEELNDGLSDFISECAWQAGFEHGIVVVPKVYNQDEWENGPERKSVFVKNILKEGVSV